MWVMRRSSTAVHISLWISRHLHNVHGRLWYVDGIEERRTSTTLLVSAWSEDGDLVGRDEPAHQVLEEPAHHLAMGGGQAQPARRGGKRRRRRAARSGPPGSCRPA